MTQPHRLMCCSSTMDSGGSERQTWNLLRGIDRALFTPSLYLLSRQGPLLAQLPGDISVEAYWDQSKTPKLNLPGRIHRRQIAHLAESLKRNRIDVVYERLFHMAMIAGPATRAARVRHVANIVSPPRNDVPRSEIKFAWLKRIFLARAYRQADRLLAVSHGAADDAAIYYRIPRERFEVVWNPVDLARIDYLKEEPWSGKPLDSNSRKIVAVGRLSHEKGHAVLLRAFAELKTEERCNLEVHVVGDGPLREDLESLSRELGIHSEVVFHGYVDNPFPLLRSAQLYVLPSLYEGLPNVLLEAMACEIPTLVTDCPGGIREATDQGTLTRSVRSNDPSAIAAGLRDFLGSEKSFTAIVPPARRRIEDYHSYPAWLRKMESILTPY